MNKNITHILVVDDDDRIRDLVKQYLTEKNFLITTAQNAIEAKNKIRLIKFDMLIVDVMMPGESGISLTKEIKYNSNIPIILLTAKSDVQDRILGLESGADDYVTKPFDPRELLSRVKNLLWRRRAHQKQKEQGTLRHFADWTLNLNKRELTTPANATQPLSAGEFHLLLALIDNAGEVLNRDQLMNKIRNREWYPDDRYIDVLVGQVRRKFRAHDPDTTFISTIHGTGYLFAPAVN